jgi:acyl-coenzyme A thioesterase PaaI-like protein
MGPDYGTADAAATIGLAMTSQAEIEAFVGEQFPQTRCTIQAVGKLTATVRHTIGAEDLRPGGTVRGGIMMEVADVALYIAILGEIGIVPLTVTTSLNINFLRKPAASRAIIGVCRLLKVGRALVIGEVALYSEGSEQMVAHAVGTYSIPPKR